MDWQLASLNPAMTPLYVGLVRTPAEDRRPDEIAALADRAAALFRIVDGALEGTGFLAGDALTLAEVAVGTFAYRWLELDVSRPPLPRLAAWYARIGARPGFTRHVAIGLS